MILKFNVPSWSSILLVYYFTSPIWRAVFFDHIPGGWILNPIIIIGLLFITILKQKSLWNTYWDIIIFYIFVAGAFFIKFFQNPDMADWIGRTYGVKQMVSWGWIFAYAVIRVQPNLYKMLDCLKKIGVVLVSYYAYQSLEVLRTGYWTYVQFGMTRQTTSNMSWSYGVLTAICFLSIYFFKDKKKWPFVFAVIGVVGILIYGSRGTLIGLIFGILLLSLFYSQKRMTFRNYLVLFALCGGIVFGLSDFGLSMISDILMSHGLNSRFIDSIKNFATFEELFNGRSRIWETAISLIKTGPFYGYGVYGERNAIYNIGMKWGYSHNIFLEILVDFGWLFGSISIVVLFFYLVLFFKSSKDKYEKLLVIIFLTIGFELVLSNSIWLHSGLWVLMGLIVNHFKCKRQRRDVYFEDFEKNRSKHKYLIREKFSIL